MSTSEDEIVVFDALTYAGTLENLRSVRGSDRLTFEEVDVRDAEKLTAAVQAHRPEAVVHFAAESHVDRSFQSPALFFETNVLGTVNLLNAFREAGGRRFLLVSTDEVYGPAAGAARYSEERCLNPTNPYSASKASAEHACLSYRRSFGTDVLIARPSNNFGSRQHIEKLIPKFVACALRGERLPLHGNGMHERDWLFVGDLCLGLSLLLDSGSPGEIYNIAGNNSLQNLEIARTVLQCLGLPADQLCFVRDRVVNDSKYSIDDSKVRRLGFAPRSDFTSVFAETIAWYRDQSLV